MARGWDSKSVEAQQDAAEAARSTAQRIPQDPHRASERATLMLARAQAVAQLQRACAATHRAMLEQAIADLDRRLADL